MTHDITKRALLKTAAAGAVLLPELQALAQSSTGTPRLLLGPMLGAPTPNAIELWAMTSGPFEVVVEFADNPLFRNARRTDPVLAKSEETFIVRPKVEGLQPNTEYWYRMMVRRDGREWVVDHQHMPLGRWRTAPLSNSEQNFKIGYGSCANYRYDRIQPIWNAVA